MILGQQSRQSQALAGNLIPTAFCSELDIYVSKLEAAIGTAKRLGGYVRGWPAMLDAQEFVHQETSLLTRSVILIGGKCEAKVEEAAGLLNRLNAAISSVGGQTVAPPAPSGGLIPKSAIPVLVIAGVGLAALLFLRLRK